MSGAAGDIYHDFIGFVSTLQDASDFKSNPSFTYVLEHVSFSHGQDYLSLILSKTPYSQADIKAYCQKNDLHGGGEKYDYGFMTTSPTNFRYIYHSFLILSHIRTTAYNGKIVELGCGYGGLCLAIDHFSKKMNVAIQDYYLVDLPEVGRLQSAYLGNHGLRFRTHFHDAAEYGRDVPGAGLFLISNYCFSEILREHQDNYIKYLFPYVAHGFMVWNIIPLFDFGFPCSLEDEDPLTGHLNKYVYF